MEELKNTLKREIDEISTEMSRYEREIGQLTKKLEKLFSIKRILEMGENERNVGNNSDKRVRRTSRKYQRWTQEEDDELQARYSKKQSAKKIAREMKRPTASIHTRASILRKKGWFLPHLIND